MNWLAKNSLLSRSPCLPILLFMLHSQTIDHENTASIMKSTSQGFFEIIEVIWFHWKEIAVICNPHYPVNKNSCTSHIFMCFDVHALLMRPWPYYHTKELSVFVILLSIFAHTPVPIRAHSRTLPLTPAHSHSLPHTPAHELTLPPMLMHGYRQENDKSRVVFYFSTALIDEHSPNHCKLVACK